MSLLPEARELFSSMTVEDNLLMGAYSRHQVAPRSRVLPPRKGRSAWTICSQIQAGKKTLLWIVQGAAVVV